jgi:hypothetical protein
VTIEVGKVLPDFPTSRLENRDYPLVHVLQEAPACVQHLLADLRLQLIAQDIGRDAVVGFGADQFAAQFVGQFDEFEGITNQCREVGRGR